MTDREQIRFLDADDESITKMKKQLQAVVASAGES
jgi:hypothetical protein